DLDKASKLLIDDFRSGKLGRLTLEFPQEQKI
ncbi:MAG TPA: ribosome biogenesis GTPase YlqF, partial [Lachnospiraceae bacterium]|nr:ribosome biogenesis GTPase YlqF [Lachnospiraceae bacterium]